MTAAWGRPQSCRRTACHLVHEPDETRTGLPDELEFGPGGLTVLWAEENTRDALFAAMQRREAYATSGTRPIVRFFAGRELPEDLCSDAGMIEKAYAGGVPMGGELPAPAASPRFLLTRQILATHFEWYQLTVYLPMLVQLVSYF